MKKLFFIKLKCPSVNLPFLCSHLLLLYELVMICKEQFKIEEEKEEKLVEVDSRYERKKEKWHKAENYTSTVCIFEIATHKGKSLPTSRSERRNKRAEKRIRES